jgi:hypothetical protein
MPPEGLKQILKISRHAIVTLSENMDRKSKITRLEKNVILLRSRRKVAWGFVKTGVA